MTGSAKSARILSCRGLLFDCDGVLVDSDDSVRRSWHRWAQAYSLDPGGLADSVHGRRAEDTVALLIDEDRRGEALTAIHRLELDDAAAVSALPGAAELLWALPTEGWAVVTSGVESLARARLAAAGLPEPAVLVTADDVSLGKPDAEGYQTAAQHLGLEASDCVVFEDSGAGVESGLAAGAVVVGISERALDTAADVVVADLRSLTWDGSALHLPGDQLLRSR